MTRKSAVKDKQIPKLAFVEDPTQRVGSFPVLGEDSRISFFDSALAASLWPTGIVALGTLFVLRIIPDKKTTAKNEQQKRNARR